MSDIVDIYTTCLHTNNRITFQCAPTVFNYTDDLFVYVISSLNLIHPFHYFTLEAARFMRSSVHEILQINSEASSHVQGTTGSYWCGVGGMTSNRRNCLKRTMENPQEFSVAAASINYISDMECISSLC